MKETIRAITHSLSATRGATYVAAAAPKDEDDPSALLLYAWNARVSAAMMVPLHICEVVVRNAASDALEMVYGPLWPWSPGFERSLLAPATGYSPQKDLQNARRRQSTKGKVIPELNFVFWQKLFSSRYDKRIWDKHLKTVFPNLDQTKSVGQLRQGIHNSIGEIRILRNRIAHHEPIFKRDLRAELQRIVTLIEIRCKVTAAWLMDNQQASAIIAQRP